MSYECLLLKNDPSVGTWFDRGFNKIYPPSDFDRVMTKIEACIGKEGEREGQIDENCVKDLRLTKGDTESLNSFNDFDHHLWWSLKNDKRFGWEDNWGALLGKEILEVWKSLTCVYFMFSATEVRDDEAFEYSVKEKVLRGIKGLLQVPPDGSPTPFSMQHGYATIPNLENDPNITLLSRHFMKELTLLVLAEFGPVVSSPPNETTIDKQLNKIRGASKNALIYAYYTNSCREAWKNYTMCKGKESQTNNMDDILKTSTEEIRKKTKTKVIECIKNAATDTTWTWVQNSIQFVENVFDKDKKTPAKIEKKQEEKLIEEKEKPVVVGASFDVPTGDLDVFRIFKTESKKPVQGTVEDSQTMTNSLYAVSCLTSLYVGLKLAQTEHGPIFTKGKYFHTTTLGSKDNILDGVKIMWNAEEYECEFPDHIVWSNKFDQWFFGGLKWHETENNKTGDNKTDHSHHLFSFLSHVRIPGTDSAGQVFLKREWEKLFASWSNYATHQPKYTRQSRRLISLLGGRVDENDGVVVTWCLPNLVRLLNFDVSGTGIGFYMQFPLRMTGRASDGGNTPKEQTPQNILAHSCNLWNAEPEDSKVVNYFDDIRSMEDTLGFSLSPENFDTFVSVWDEKQVDDSGYYDFSEFEYSAKAYTIFGKLEGVIKNGAGQSVQWNHMIQKGKNGDAGKYCLEVARVFLNIHSVLQKGGIRSYSSPDTQPPIQNFVCWLYRWVNSQIWKIVGLTNNRTPVKWESKTIVELESDVVKHMFRSSTTVAALQEENVHNETEFAALAYQMHEWGKYGKLWSGAMVKKGIPLHVLTKLHNKFCSKYALSIKEKFKTYTEYVYYTWENNSNRKKHDVYMHLGFIYNTQKGEEFIKELIGKSGIKEAWADPEQHASAFKEFWEGIPENFENKDPFGIPEGFENVEKTVCEHLYILVQWWEKDVVGKYQAANTSPTEYASGMYAKARGELVEFAVVLWREWKNDKNHDRFPSHECLEWMKPRAVVEPTNLETLSDSEMIKQKVHSVVQSLSEHVWKWSIGNTINDDNDVKTKAEGAIDKMMSIYIKLVEEMDPQLSELDKEHLEENFYDFLELGTEGIQKSIKTIDEWKEAVIKLMICWKSGGSDMCDTPVSDEHKKEHKKNEAETEMEEIRGLESEFLTLMEKLSNLYCFIYKKRNNETTKTEPVTIKQATNTPFFVDVSNQFLTIQTGLSAQETMKDDSHTNIVGSLVFFLTGVAPSSENFGALEKHVIDKLRVSSLASPPSVDDETTDAVEDKAGGGEGMVSGGEGMVSGGEGMVSGGEGMKKQKKITTQQEKSNEISTKITKLRPVIMETDGTMKLADNLSSELRLKVTGGPKTKTLESDEPLGVRIELRPEQSNGVKNWSEVEMYNKIKFFFVLMERARVPMEWMQHLLSGKQLFLNSGNGETAPYIGEKVHPMDNLTMPITVKEFGVEMQKKKNPINFLNALLNTMIYRTRDVYMFLTRNVFHVESNMTGNEDKKDIDIGEILAIRVVERGIPHVERLIGNYMVVEEEPEWVGKLKAIREFRIFYLSTSDPFSKEKIIKNIHMKNAIKDFHTLSGEYIELSKDIYTWFKNKKDEAIPTGMSRDDQTKYATSLKGLCHNMSCANDDDYDELRTKVIAMYEETKALYDKFLMS
jgi:hypothetical protein